MTKMLCAVSMSVFLTFTTGMSQTSSSTDKRILLEKRAVTDLQQTNVSDLDTKLPKVPFSVWFRQQVGNKAGIVWQLNECGGGASANEALPGDQRACSEVNAVLADNRKVILMISIGSFRRGVYGNPAFYYGVMEKDGEFYQIRNLDSLPSMLRGDISKTDQASKDEIMVRLPSVGTANISITNIEQTIDPRALLAAKPAENLTDGAPPPPPAPDAPAAKTTQPNQAAKNSSLTADLNIAEIPTKNIKGGAMSWASAIRITHPQYPSKALRFNTSGIVEVQVTINEQGLVTDALALSGPALLREAAVEAAFQWVFNPTKINGASVVTQIVIPFKFKAPR